MNKIIINEITPDCEKEIIFTCKKESRLFTSNIISGINISSGKHSLKIKRHHDFFLDWYINDQLVEEFLIWQVVSNGESTFSIRSTEDVFFDNEEEVNGIIKKEIFPFIASFENDVINFSITCLRHSQLSIFFKEETFPNFKTITLVFNEDYCKVYLDTYKDGHYQSELRENLSLFNFEKGKEILFSIEKSLNKMKISNNVIELKEYDLKDCIDEYCSRILMRESYSFDGAGCYTINLI